MSVARSASLLLFVITAPTFAQTQSSGTTAEFRGISAASEQVIWASGSRGVFARTLDGGRTWTADSIGGAGNLFLVDVHAVDANSAYIVGTDFSGGYAAIYKTTNGGQSWTRQWEKRHAQVFLDGIAFWDANTGIAFSDPVDGSFLILRTENGGATWTEVPRERIPPPLPGEAAFAASGTNLTALAPGHAWFVTGVGLQARVYHTADRGQTWTVAATPFAAGQTRGLFGIAFRDARNGIAVGGDFQEPKAAQPNVLRTTDGGKTWVVVGTSAPAGVRYGVTYQRDGDRVVVVATGPSGYGISTDEGKTWSALDTVGYNTLTARGAQVWLGGPQGRIVRLAPGTAPAPERQYSSNFSRELPETPVVRDALAWLESNYPSQIEEWIRITEIPGTSRHEQQRGAYVKAEMEKEGLTVSVDSIGNVVGVRKGSGGGASVVFAAHLDTVHPLDTNVRVKRDGDILRAPGIFDNSASVANMLAVIRALNRAKIKTQGDLIFIGTAQEELGLRGMDYWLEKNLGRARTVVALDGGLGSVNYGALGIYWTRYAFQGAGSHTNTSTGKPHPARALADAIRSIYEIRVPDGRGGAVYNVGMLAGGKIFNAIPEEVSFTMDLRSVNPALLDSLNQEIEVRVARAAEAHKVKWEKEVVQQLAAGGTEDMLRDRRAHPLVQTAVDIHSYLGMPAPAVASGSTDSNAAVVRGIPSISVGRARGGDQHTLSEWSDQKSALPATKMVLLLAVAMARLSIVQ
ncbi:MAG TPA: M20/M25/M40 family metallo-hydrolase [Longimicrobiales bacterium]|nr:M20/M25/M40 family metallo-hydrolase [Longimicrobiales bacterium]